MYKILIVPLLLLLNISIVSADTYDTLGNRYLCGTAVVINDFTVDTQRTAGNGAIATAHFDTYGDFNDFHTVTLNATATLEVNDSPVVTDIFTFSDTIYTFDFVNRLLSAQGNYTALLNNGQNDDCKIVSKVNISVHGPQCSGISEGASVRAIQRFTC